MADQEIEGAVSRALDEAPDRNFTESVDLAINLRDLDLNDPSNRVDESVVLPEGTGQETTIVVIADGETGVRAAEVADRVVDSDELAELGDDEDAAKELAAEADFVVAEAALMQDVASTLGQILGPRGMMPGESAVVQPDDDVVDIVETLANSVQLRSGDRRTFHALVGAEAMSADDIASNVDVILRRLYADLEKGPQNVDSVYVKTTMGPAVEVV